MGKQFQEPADKANTYSLVASLYQKRYKQGTSAAEIHALLVEAGGPGNHPSYPTVARAVSQTKAFLKKGKIPTMADFKDRRAETGGGEPILKDEIVFQAMKKARQEISRRKKITGKAVLKQVRGLMPRYTRLPCERTIRRRMQAIAADPEYARQLSGKSTSDMDYPRIFEAQPGTFWQIDATDLDLVATDSRDSKKPIYLTTIVDVATRTYLAGVLSVDQPDQKHIFLAITLAISNPALGGYSTLPEYIQFDRASVHKSKVTCDALKAIEIKHILIPAQASKLQSAVEKGHDKLKKGLVLVTPPPKSGEPLYDATLTGLIREKHQQLKDSLGDAPGPLEIIRYSVEREMMEQNQTPTRRLGKRPPLAVLRDALQKKSKRADMNSVIQALQCPISFSASKGRFSIPGGALQYVAPPSVRLSDKVTAMVPPWWVSIGDWGITLSTFVGNQGLVQMVHRDANPREPHPPMDLLKDWQRWTSSKSLCVSGEPTRVDPTYDGCLPRPVRSGSKSKAKERKKKANSQGSFKKLNRTHLHE